jgi:hypothetical protein
VNESGLDHSEELARLEAVRALTARLADEQQTCHERVLIDAAVSEQPILRGLDGAALCDLRNDMQCERARQVLSARTGKIELDAAHYSALIPGSSLHWRFGATPLAWWQTQQLRAEGGTRGVPHMHQVDVGEPMCARSDGSYVWGVYDGYDALGRAYLRARGRFHATLYAVEWTDAFFLRPVGWSPDRETLRVPVLGAATQVAETSVSAALDASIDASALGDYSIRDFINAIERQGYFVCTRGSAVRGAITGAPVKDVDLVTTAPTIEVRRIINETAPEFGIGDTGGSFGAQEAGVFRVLPKQIGIKEGAGFDITGLRRWHWEPPPDPTSATLLPRFSLNLEEDAWATDWHINTFYAHLGDRGTWLLADPTGGSQRDILQSHLRETKAWSNPRLSIRFWKFRLRGFQADAETKARMRQHLLEVVRAQPLDRLTWYIEAIAASQLATREKLDAFMNDLSRVMHEDGSGDLFNRYFGTETFRTSLAYADGRRLHRESPKVDEENPELW